MLSKLHRFLRRKNPPCPSKFSRLLAEQLEERTLLAAVAYQLHFVAPGGAATGPDLASVNVGDEYDLVVTAQDLRNPAASPPGVFAGYLDIGYDSAKTHVQVSEVQNLTFSGFSAGSTFKLTFDGQTTADINYSSNKATLAASVQSALASLSNIGAGNVAVDVPPQFSTFDLAVRFNGKFYDTDVPTLTGTTGVSVEAQGDLQTTTGKAYAFKEAFRSHTVGNLYQYGVGANDATNLLDEVGAFFSGNTSLGSGTTEVELVRARMVATATGTVTFTPDVTNMTLPADATLLFGLGGAVPSSEIIVAPKTLSIAATPYQAINDSITVSEDSSATTIDVLANDTAAAGQTKQVLGFTEAAHGTVAFSGSGLAYTPAANFSGTDTFTYTANTNGSTTADAAATVTVTVTPLNDSPTLDPISDRTINEDAAQQLIPLSGISAGGGESQTLTVKATSDNAALTGDIAVNYSSPNSTGSLSFTPTGNHSGTATITVTVQDDGGTAAGGVDTIIRTFTVTVLAVNDAPSFTKGADQETNDEAGDVLIVNWATAISAGADDESNQTLTFTVTADTTSLFKTQPAIDAAGNLSFTPNLNADATALVTVVLHDNGGADNGGADSSSEQTFAIHVAKLHPLHNAVKPLDATGDNAVTAADSLDCINFINAVGAGAIGKAPPDSGYLDVNSDGFITAADPLDVINYINANGPDNGNSEAAAIDLLVTAAPPAAMTQPPKTDTLASVIALLAMDDNGQSSSRRRT